MREEAAEWFREALKDLEVAKRLLELGYYNHAAFNAHQATEKALKALIIEKLRVLPPKTHNLIELMNKLVSAGVDVSEIADDVRDLNPHYLVSRYPDAANGVPSEVYSRRMAENCVNSAVRVVEWVRKSLGL